MDLEERDEESHLWERVIYLFHSAFFCNIFKDDVKRRVYPSYLTSISNLILFKFLIVMQCISMYNMFLPSWPRPPPHSTHAHLNIFMEVVAMELSALGHAEFERSKYSIIASPLLYPFISGFLSHWRLWILSTVLILFKNPKTQAPLFNCVTCSDWIFYKNFPGFVQE